MNKYSMYSILIISVSIFNVDTAEKIGKKLTNYNDADLERLLDQWNVSISF